MTALHRNFLSFLLLILALFAVWPGYAAYTDNSDGTVTDTVTGLMWDKCSWGQSNNTDCSSGAATAHNWVQALGVAVTANAMNSGAGYKGYSDWRLPNFKELESLVKIDAFNPAIDATAFPNSESNFYWSSTILAASSSGAWIVYFHDGNAEYGNIVGGYYVRLVRNGQLFDSFDSQPGIAYSADTFTEAATNDGSIAGSITLTLSGDTYAAAVVTSSKITAVNVPAGLTANFVRDSNTQITATLTGNATNHANANDIADLTFTFADGAFTNTATAASVTNYTKNNLTVDFANPAAITYAAAVVTSSAAAFTEAAANDGSIAAGVTLTLSGDTYAAAVVTSNKITAVNVPAGLTAHFVRDSNTQITATLTGNATNHANANDIADLTFTFADGAFTNTATAASVTNYTKNNLTVDFDDPAAVTYSAGTFTEAAANDGSIANGITLTLSGDTYAAAVVTSNKITAVNVPAGLTANFVRDSNTQITATLTGNASNHADANDVSNLTFTFADGAFTNTATAASVANYTKNNLTVDFADPAAVTYSAATFTEAAANDGSIAAGIILTLSGDTYAAAVVTSNKITAVNVPAGLTAHFVRDSNTQITATLTGNAVAHANANDIANLTFTFADGAFTNTATAANVNNYVKNNLTVDFADPLAVTYSTTTFTEAAVNDGSIAAGITLTLSGDTFVADVVSAGRITATNVPAGLTAHFVRDGNSQITATLTGNATNHANANDVNNLTFTFANGAFTNTATAANVTNYAKNNLVVDFADPASAPAPSYNPGPNVPPAPDVINTSAGGETTLTGATPVNAAPGSTLTIPAGVSASGAAITLAAPVAGTSSHPVTIKIEGGILSVTTPAGSGSTVKTTTVSLGGKDTMVLNVSAGSAKVTASAAGQPLVSVGAGANAAVISSGSASATVITSVDKTTGVTSLTLPKSATSNDADASVNMTIGGQDVNVKPSGGNDVVVTLKTVTVNGVSSQVVSVTDGSATVTASRPNQQLLAVGGGTGGNAIVVTADTAGTAATSTVNHSTGETSIAVSSGVVTLPTNAFASAGNGFAAIKDGKIYAGEIAVLNSAGKITGVRLGSQSGVANSVGDPVNAQTGSAAGVAINVAVPNLKGKVARISDSQDFGEVIVAALGAGFTANGQNSSGVLSLTFPGGGSANALPLGEISVDTGRADGMSVIGNGKVEVVKSGVIARFAPSVADPALLAGQVVALDKGALVSVNDYGVLQATVHGVTYALQPAWAVNKAGDGAAGFTVDAAGHVVYQDGAGNRQMLYPAFADFAQLIAAFQPDDAYARATGNDDGTVTAKYQGRSYTLTPDYVLTPVPAEHAKDAWWLDGGKVYVKTGDGKSAQGFNVK